MLGKEVLAGDFRIVLGSASAIFACGVRKLGNAVTFVSKVGDDAFGRDCRRALRENGISDKQVKVDRDSTTGVTISLSAAKDRALVTHLGAIAELEMADIAGDVFDRCAHVHMTSFFLQHALRSSFASIFRKAHQQGSTTSFDPNSDPSQSWKADVWDVIAETDILFVNESEALELSRKRTVERALTFLGSTAPCVVIKRGPNGAIAIRDGEMAMAAGFPIRVVDTTGAGDSFAAGFVHGYLERRGLSECLEFANACGALSALQAGGTAGQPTRMQLAQFLGKHRKGKTRVVSKAR
jgi:sugar/nucleoside kinase (ribokinase family)